MSLDDLMQSSQMMAPPPPMKRLPDDLGLPQNRHLGLLSILCLPVLRGQRCGAARFGSAIRGAVFWQAARGRCR